MLQSLHLCSGFVQGGFREFSAEFGPPDGVRAIHRVLKAGIGAAGDRVREIFGDFFIRVSSGAEMVRWTISAANGRNPGGRGVECRCVGVAGWHPPYAC